VSTTPAQSRIAAHASWARTADRGARTAPARAGLDAKFAREAREILGPDASDRQVADAAESARKAFYLSMAARSAASRRRSA
jgi:hypothetical protein